MPHPKTDLKQKTYCIAANNLIWPESTKRFNRNQDWHSDDLRSRNPVFHTHKIAEINVLLNTNQS